VLVIFIPKESQPRALRLRHPKASRTVIGCLATVAFVGTAVAGIFADQHGGADATDVLWGWLLLLIAGMVVVNSAPLWVSVPTDTSRAVSPVDVLRQDLRTDVVVIVAKRALIATIIWLYAGTQVTLGYIAYAVGATLISLVLGEIGPANRSYTDARLRLALCGRLPWRLMRFLDDAHRRGVLRRVGAFYQFRHIWLQEHLAAKSHPLRISWLERLLTAFAEHVERRRGTPAPPEGVIAQSRPWGTLLYSDPRLAKCLSESRKPPRPRQSPQPTNSAVRLPDRRPHNPPSLAGSRNMAGGHTSGRYHFRTTTKSPGSPCGTIPLSCT